MVIYNPYCDQQFWLSRKVSLNVSDKVIKHPILSYRNSKVSIPNDFDNSLNLKNTDTTFYGSSFIGHSIFKSSLKTLGLTIQTTLPSYGLDQMYLSYLLTQKS